MIDLHLHTTASDGRSSPEQLIADAAAAGVTVLAVTDHDTVAATDEVAAACGQRGLQAVSGIEITAVEKGRDIHVLGYFIDHTSRALLTFLARQREQRIDRVQAIVDRLAAVGLPVEVSEVLSNARQQTGRSIGRPQVADAMVRAGHVKDRHEAFDAWLGNDMPAYVPRAGVSPEHVIAVIHAAGGLASLAHPGRTAIDKRIQPLRDAGLDAIEAYHSDHTPDEQARYVRMAADLDLLVTGGSDYHADPSRHVRLGSVSLPHAAWERLVRQWPQPS